MPWDEGFVEPALRKEIPVRPKPTVADGYGTTTKPSAARPMAEAAMLGRQYSTQITDVATAPTKGDNQLKKQIAAILVHERAKYPGAHKHAQRKSPLMRPMIN